jgi:hypothetical protein
MRDAHNEGFVLGSRLFAVAAAMANYFLFPLPCQLDNIDLRANIARRIKLMEVRPVRAQEVAGMMVWGAARFHELYPHCAEHSMQEWLERVCDSNEIMFCRTDNACGAAMLVHAPWDASPVVCELFVVSAPKAKPFESISVYREMMSWGRQKGAYALEFGSGNGIGLETVAKRLNAKQKAIVYRVGLEQ